MQIVYSEIHLKKKNFHVETNNTYITITTIKDFCENCDIS